MNPQAAASSSPIPTDPTQSTPLEPIMPDLTSEPEQQPTKKSKKLLHLIPAILIIAATITAYFLIDFTAIHDWNLGRSFEPTAEMSQIMDNLPLTDTSLRILRASHPTLKDGADFSEKCGNDGSEVSILGCYASGNIYIKHVTDPDLTGILESTVAHELLHAVWTRLDTSTQRSLTEQLAIIYEQHEDTLATRLESYEQSRRFDELHSIVGTEYADIPESLRTHYSEYFTDQAKVVAYYQSYNSKFQALRAESDRLEQEIAALKEKINANTENYEDGVATINAEIEDFRRRVENGSFDNNPSAFYREQNELNARIDQLNSLFESINSDIDHVNSLIDQYNQNAASLNDLNAAISSPPAPPSV